MQSEKGCVYSLNKRLTPVLVEKHLYDNREQATDTQKYQKY